MRTVWQNMPAAGAAQADGRIRQNVLALPALQKAQTIFCYVGRGAEIDTAPLLQSLLDMGKQVAVPLCGANGQMGAHVITGLSQLQAGSYGILEPPEHAPQLAPQEIDLALVPCLSCSIQGWRLGQGAGYYDRYLSQTTQNCYKVALCREACLQNSVPHCEHDIQMNCLVTESAVYVVCAKVLKLGTPNYWAYPKLA